VLQIAEYDSESGAPSKTDAEMTYQPTAGNHLNANARNGSRFFVAFRFQPLRCHRPQRGHGGSSPSVFICGSSVIGLM
jgi:hypothetical protein